MKFKNLTDEVFGTICTYMDDEIREDLHSELSPCTPEYFLNKYLEYDSDFKELLKSEFDYVISE